MPSKHLVPVLLLSFAAAAPLAANAHELVYAAPLLGASESPAVDSPGTGFAKVTIDLDLVTMRVEASFNGLIGNATAAHIHCCTAEPGQGNVGVASQTPSFSGFPLGGTSGTYDKTFDLSQASSYSASFISANGNTVGGAFNALLAGLDAGKAYFNVHTTAFAGGEVRGLLSPVPEPASYALVLGGMLVMGGMARRRGGV